MQFLYCVANELCHDGMTGKGGGENVTEVNMNIVGMDTFLFLMEFLYFFMGKYLHYSTFNDVIMLHQELCHSDVIHLAQHYK